jgi:hypothetical protein
MKISCPLLICSCVLLSTACTTFHRTVNMEHRVFVRVPSKTIEKGILTDNDTGWHFRHVLEGPSAQEQASQWYVAWRNDQRDRLTNSGLLAPWPGAMKLVPEIADAAFRKFGVYPQLVEPGLSFKETSAEKGSFPRQCAFSEKSIPKMQVGELPSEAWPSPPVDSSGLMDPLWYQDDNHTQLAAARERAARKHNGRNIRIGILDTGFDSRNHGIPTNLVDKPEADIIQSLRRDREICSDGSCSTDATTPGQTSPVFSGHGTGTLGILAGRKVKLTDPHGRFKPGTYQIGAAPDAEIHPVRIAPWVASLSTANLACAIDYASRQKKCDILSISHGGSPSMMWTDAVNAAYDRGTAMFAACGDYFPLPLLPYPFNSTGIIVPSSSVYPAAYRRVMGVTGITAAGKPYAHHDDSLYWKHFLKPSAISTHSFMRGSYGADGVRRTFLPRAKWERARTDIVQLDIHNELRANPIATYSPAIPWLKAGHTHTIDMGGAGTSAATPQAAAAAAHWLAYHEDEIKAAGAWNNWRKAEATYLAMAYSAERKWDTINPRPEDQIPDMYLGCGTLKANAMLDITYQKAMSIQGRTLHKPSRFSKDRTLTGSPRDHYDADRSFIVSVFKLDPSSAGSRDIANRADPRLDHRYVYRSPHQKQQALANIYFNMLLIQQFQWGNNPINKNAAKADSLGNLLSLSPDEHQLETKAEKLAAGKKSRATKGPRR